jgi:lipoyl(octanoyl) transferase
VQSDRGGDVTFHGPGQVVAYPIVKLNDHRLSVGGYVRKLELAIIDALADIGIGARREEGAVGIWCDAGTNGKPAGKVCAIGVRIRRGVSLHGVALNVTTDLRYFNLIVPCGLAGRPVTSVSQILGEKAPEIETVRKTLADRLVKTFS